MLSHHTRASQLLRAGTAVLCLLAAAAARGAFVYESATEFYSSGDFNGDGLADVLVLDKATGNARVGYSGGNGSLTWSAALVTGAENLTGCGVGHFLQPASDSIAVTAPRLNQVRLVDLSQTNAAGTAQTVTPIGIGPHAVVGLASPLAPPSGGLPFLLVASSFNNQPAERLDLLQWFGAPLFYGLFNETNSFERPNALDLNTNTATFAVGLARGTNDAFHLWQFTNSPAVLLAFTNLASGSDYTFGNFNGEALPRFIFYRTGDSNLTIVPLLQTNATLGFGAPLVVPLSQGVQHVFYVTLGSDGAALLQFGDGVQGLRLPGGSPVFSAKYQTGAGAAGNVFTGIVPLTNGQFALLDAPPGSAGSAHAQVLQFDGTTFTQRSASTLPTVSSRGTRANVWLFQLEPFVNRSAGFIASLNSPDWADGVTGLPGTVQVLTENDAGTANGLGGVATNNLGSPPGGAAFGLANQYNPAISLFSFSAPHAAEPIAVTISPPAGSYGSPLSISFSATPANAGVRYRVGDSDSWHSYAATFSISNDVVIQFYGTNAAGTRSSLQFAGYSLGVPASGPPASPVNIAPGNTNTPPAINTNQVILSQDGTVFYGRRSPGNSNLTIWAINLDGSGDTYITTGFRPRASRDGRWLAFLRGGNPVASQADVWVRDMQTGLEQMLFRNFHIITCYDWEPNDAALLTDYTCGIWELNTNGSASQLGAIDCYDAAPVRNPVDGRIAFHNQNPNPAVRGLYVANPDGSGAQRLGLTVNPVAWASWSPDGQKLSFVNSALNNVLSNGPDIYIVNPDGSGLSQVSGLAGTNGFPNGVLWSPEGDALVGAGTVFNTNGLWVIPLDFEQERCDGPPYRLPTTPGDPIDFAGSIVVAPSPSQLAAQPPGLFIRQAPTAVVVYWSTSYAGYTLESRNDLSPGTAWTPVSGPYYLAGSYYEYWEAKASLQTQKYFRLHYTGAMVLSEPPSPTIQLSPGAVSLSWPTNFTAFVLETTTNLVAPVVWQSTPASYGINLSNYVYQEAITGLTPRKFFRLRGP